MIITADFGGTSIKLGLVEKGIVHAYKVIDSYSDDPFTKWIPLLRDDLLSLCASVGMRFSDVEGMVWALPLIIAPGLRHATCSFGKYEDAIEINFCNQVEERLQIPLVLENDARAALIGEWQSGSARDKDNVVMITLGTGIGTGVIFEGKPMRGRSGMAGNLGGLSITHLNSEDSGKRAPGCIESQVATWALPKRVCRMKGYEDSLLACESHIDYMSVFLLADQGDRFACQLREAALTAWGALALNMIQAYDSECVVFGGGIMASKDVILPAIREFVNRHALQPGGSVQILATELGDQAALIGGEWIWNTRTKK